MDVELMTLGFLNSGPKTGYKLNRIFGNLMLYYAISLNQIYPVLRSLEGRGLVEKQVIFQEGKPNKNLYTITEPGRQFLEEKLTSQPRPLDYHLPFLVRVFFFRFLDKEQACEEFRKEVESLQEQKENLETMADKVAERADCNGSFAYRTAVHLLESLIQWYEAEWDKRREKLNRKEGGGCSNTGMKEDF